MSLSSRVYSSLNSLGGCGVGCVRLLQATAARPGTRRKRCGIVSFKIPSPAIDKPWDCGLCGCCFPETTNPGYFGFTLSINRNSAFKFSCIYRNSWACKIRECTSECLAKRTTSRPALGWQPGKKAQDVAFPKKGY